MDHKVTDNNLTWLTLTAQAAKAAGHIFPEAAACEAALESNYGQSMLAKQANNLFGMKQHTHPVFGTLSLPTRECINDQWVVTNADWVKYPDQMACYSDRMSTLLRLRDAYPHYNAALEASDARTYIIEVSQTWSTDPQRGAKVLAIYNDFMAPESSPEEVDNVQ
jgi:flagellum-specific peptidoglycan hydrolase FlgJ